MRVLRGFGVRPIWRARRLHSRPDKLLQDAAEEAAKGVNKLFETTRLGVNELLRQSVGLEVRKSAKGASDTARSDKNAEFNTDVNARRQAGAALSAEENREISSFWKPYGPQSPFVDRAAYLRQFQRVYVGQQKFTNAATAIVTEEEIRQYVQDVIENGDLSAVGLPSFLVPHTVYSNVVKIVLHAVQTVIGRTNGQALWGREIYFLKRRSLRSQWRVSGKQIVDREIVKKLAERMSADHKDEVGWARLGSELQSKMYQNVIAIVFRSTFDLIESCQLRVLGHTVTINIEADQDLAQAPGWEVPIDDGIFGCFDELAKDQFINEFVDDILEDDSINLIAVPDVLEKELYRKVLMVLFMILETAFNHMRLHLAGISFRPSSDAVTAGRDKSLTSTE